MLIYSSHYPIYVRIKGGDYLEFKHYSASSYLLKVHGATGSLFGGLGAISLNTSLELKKKIKETHTDLAELGTIKGVLSAQAETAKQINLVWVIVTFVLSAILSPTIFYLGQGLKTVDWQHEKNMYIYKEALKPVKSVEEQAEYITEAVLKESSDYNKYLSVLQKAQGKVLLIIVSILLLSFSIFFLRYQWIISLKECVDNAYTEQEKLLAEKKEEDIRAATLIKEKREKDIRDAALILEVRNSRMLKKQ